MQHLSLEALRAFISVYELQSYTAAAQQLSRSQPAISLQLQRLEELLGSQLLQRSGGRIHLTEAGRELWEQAKHLLNINDQIFAKIAEPSLTGVVRLGIPSEFASKLLPQVLGQFAQSYPHVTLSVTSALSKELLAQEQQQFDLVIALKEPDKRLTRAGLVLLKQDSLVWVSSIASNQLAAVTDSAAEAVPLVVAPEGCIYRRRALQVLRQHTIPLRISYTNADFSGLTAAIDSGLGITVLAQSTLPDNLIHVRHVGSHALPELGNVSVVMWQADSDNPAATQLAQFIQERI
ncbi:MULTISPECIES: LysR substrate-binding domain-containing protein [Idiomarina]|uniref:LysR substrate-binding domain-containing protein n=1 Tax=Idiomarina TaxID=135575 RepID=UPI00129A8FEF|nr:MULTISPECIES: LysR family transcriptional regulator [Idiomarina]MRJ41539.1 LysR family transcriptional regulator [Idiomarina sp. FeN1]NCU57529.1 LysR family transcriptional regulator [Idiomarina sp. FenA--70]NCU60081.1 LysR family transcriptional regulator [Idiomarina sp. FenBw--71]UUN13822.1 LysR family transcriptional regulator [Idiomarina loihiensis]